MEKKTIKATHCLQSKNVIEAIKCDEKIENNTKICHSFSTIKCEFVEVETGYYSLISQGGAYSRETTVSLENFIRINCVECFSENFPNKLRWEICAKQLRSIILEALRWLNAVRSTAVRYRKYMYLFLIMFRVSVVSFFSSSFIKRPEIVYAMYEIGFASFDLLQNAFFFYKTESSRCVKFNYYYYYCGFLWNGEHNMRVMCWLMILKIIPIPSSCVHYYFRVT